MPGNCKVAGYTYSATGMTGKSDHPARWRTEWIGLKHPRGHECLRGARCSVFKDRCALTAGLAARHAWARHQALPRRTKEYSAAAEVCLAAGAKAAEAALAQLQDTAVERFWSQIQRIGRDRLAVELGAPLLDQASRLAGADLKSAGHQQG